MKTLICNRRHLPEQTKFYLGNFELVGGMWLHVSCGMCTAINNTLNIYTVQSYDSVCKHGQHSHKTHVTLAGR